MGKVGDFRKQSCMVLKGKAPLFQHEEEAGRVINDKKTDKKTKCGEAHRALYFLGPVFCPGSEVKLSLINPHKDKYEVDR